MIEESLHFLKNEINIYLNQKLTQSLEDRVVLGDVARIADEGDLNNKIIISLINIEEDRISRNPENFVKIDNKVIYKNPNMNLNLYCLFTVNREKDYSGALKHLSLIIQFFQHKNVFTHENSPVLDGSIEKLIFDLHNLSFEQINQLWSVLGGKYLPSVIYKMRMITIDEGSLEAEGELIKEIDLNSDGFTH
jgi:Pvc16 N-terminal domain